MGVRLFSINCIVERKMHKTIHSKYLKQQWNLFTYEENIASNFSGYIKITVFIFAENN